MIKKPLSELFQAMYHGKYDYCDFISGHLGGRYKLLKINEDQPTKKRLVYAPDKTMKIYHNFLNLFLFEYLNTNERVLFSYRKGVNVISAVKKHAHNRHFFQADIQDFFPNIDSGMIRKVIENTIGDSPISDLTNHVDRIVELVTINNELPIGFPASPLISNAVLRPFDDALEDYCIKRDMIYTRYSDDIIISSKNKNEIANIAPTIENLFRTIKLERLKLNHEKTKITSIGRKVKLLGLVILPNGAVSIDIKLKQKIETMLHFYITNNEKFINFVDTDLKKGEKRLSGYINYVNTVDPTYLDKLRKKYGVTAIDSLIHQRPKWN